MGSNKVTKIHLHLGAHKTASSHLTRMLRRNINKLELSHVKISRKLEIRQNLTRQLGKGRLFTQQDGQAFSQLIGEKTISILNDENIPGVPKSVFRGGVLYPHAEKRFRRCMQLLEGHPVTLFLGIRHPAAFITSSYCETMRSSGYLPFEKYIDRTKLHQLRWAPYIERLARSAPDSQFHIWTHESYKENWRIVLARFLDASPEDESRFLWLDKDSRPGMSERVFQELRTRSLSSDTPLTGKEIDTLIQEHPKSQDNPAPSVLTDNERQILTEQYEQDIAEISKLSNVSMIG